jgi:hypothetical protein
MAQVVEHLPSKLKLLNSKPNTSKHKKAKLNQNDMAFF